MFKLSPRAEFVFEKFAYSYIVAGNNVILLGLWFSPFGDKLVSEVLEIISLIFGL